MSTVMEKPSRMDFRLSRAQREHYEKAAALKGQTLTQWATSHLDESARRDIEESTKTVLSDEAFQTFCDILDAPMPQATRELLASKAVWE